MIANSSVAAGKARWMVCLILGLAALVSATGSVLGQPKGDDKVQAIYLLEIPGTPGNSRLTHALAADDGYYLAGKSWTKETGTDLWLWRIDAEGNKVWEKTLPRSERKLYEPEIVGLLLDAEATSKPTDENTNGGVRLVVRRGVETWMLLVSSEGEIQQPTDVERIEYTRGVIPFEDDLLFYGSSKTDTKHEPYGWAARIDHQGHVVWKRDFDLTNAGPPNQGPRKNLPPGRHRSDLFYAATPLVDGSLLLAGMSGEVTKFRQGPSKICLLRLTANGEKIAAAFLDGAKVSLGSGEMLAATAEGVLASYTMSDLPPIGGAPYNFPPSFDASVARFDLDLKKVWDKPVPPAFMPGSVTIKGPAPYVTASMLGPKLVVQGMGDDGAKQWVSRIENPDSFATPIATLRSTKNTVVVWNNLRHRKPDAPDVAQAMIVVIDEPLEPRNE